MCICVYIGIHIRIQLLILMWMHVVCVCECIYTRKYIFYLRGETRFRSTHSSMVASNMYVCTYIHVQSCLHHTLIDIGHVHLSFFCPFPIVMYPQGFRARFMNNLYVTTPSLIAHLETKNMACHAIRTQHQADYCFITR